MFLSTLADSVEVVYFRLRLELASFAEARVGGGGDEEVDVRLPDVAAAFPNLITVKTVTLTANSHKIEFTFIFLRRKTVFSLALVVRAVY